MSMKSEILDVLSKYTNTLKNQFITPLNSRVKTNEDNITDLTNKIAELEDRISALENNQ